MDSNAQSATCEFFAGVKELAKFLGVDESTIYRLKQRRGVPFIKVGGHCLFRRSEIEAWLQSRTIHAAAPRARGRK